MIKNFVGIDISEEKLDICLYPDKTYKQYSNNKQGISSLKQYLKKHQIEQIIMEATGGLESLCANTLQDAGYNVAVVNPALICYFRKSLGYKAKTDLIDSEVIALYGEKMHPQNNKKTSKEERKLRELSARRRQLVSMRDGERNRLRRVRDEYAKKDIQATIVYLNERISKIEEMIIELIKNQKDKKEIFEILNSIPGFGKIISLTLIGLLPELGNLNQKQIASLAGVFPANVESGKGKTHKKMCFSGRPQIRSALYLGALVGVRYNSFLHQKYNDLLAKGKTKKVALGACMRKLIIIANSMVKEKRLWHE